jgi:DNA-binding NtrC family response regulator
MATADSSAQGPAPRVILVVDDEADILDSFRHLLENSIPGAQVRPCTSGRQALKVLANEPVDLVMSDFKMPGMDGIEFLVQARYLRPSLPRVMFTAFADEDLARRAVSEALVDDFLSKGVDPEQMVETVQRLLEAPAKGRRK